MLDQLDIEAHVNDPVPAPEMLIDGQWTTGIEGAETNITSPVDGSTLGTIASGSRADVDRAVTAARHAFDDGRWSACPPALRKKVLHRIADLIEQHALELAVLGSRDNGTEISMSIKAEPGSAAATFRYYAECVDKVYGEIAATPPGTLGMVHKEAVGVVGAIIPWNFPLMISAWKIAPALAAGNSMVVKPPEVASFSMLRLAQLCQEAGLPDGVLNVVTGQGSVVGAAIADHMDIDVLAFTGSGATGRRLLEASARSNLKRVYLELGGKSPNIIFDDYDDLDMAANVAAGAIFRNSGQVCVAGSRVLVQRSIYQSFLDKFKTATDRLIVGDPLNVATQAGAIASQDQCQSVMGKIEAAKADGLALVTGGEQILVQTGGTYIAPTIFADVPADNALAQDEVFGPVAAVTPFDTEEEAIALANSTVYGLAGAAWTNNLSRAHRMISAVKTGVMHINTYGGADVTVPLGGHGQSGNGYDKSLHALEKYMNLKTAWINLG